MLELENKQARVIGLARRFRARMAADVRACCPTYRGQAIEPREAFGVRGACSRFRTRSESRKREQAPRTPNASRLGEPQKFSTACSKLGNTPFSCRLFRGGMNGPTDVCHYKLLANCAVAELTGLAGGSLARRANFIR